MPRHEHRDREERDGQPLGRLGKKAGGSARAEHGGRRAAAEPGTRLRARTALHQDHHDHGGGDQHVDDVEEQQHRKTLRSFARARPGTGQDASALAMALKSAATSDAPPTRPPSTSACENRAAALSAFTLPPYRIGSKSAILASSDAIPLRMNACTACTCSGVAVLPVPIAQTGS